MPEGSQARGAEPESANPTVFTMTGDCKVGTTLGVDLKGYAGEVTYQWGLFSYSPSTFFDPVEGQTGPSFVITPDFWYPADSLYDYRLGVRVTTIDGPQDFSCEAVILGDPPAAIVAPSMSGGMRAGTDVIANPGTWSVESANISIEWELDGVTMRQQSGPTVRLSGGFVGKSIRAVIRVKARGYQTATYKTTARTVLSGGVAPFKTNAAGAISGILATGNTLTFTPTDLTPKPTSRDYQWLRNGKPISGATSATLVLSRADIGTSLSVAEKANLNGYTSVGYTTQSASKVLDVFTASTVPTISGTRAVGSTLTTTNPAVTPTATRVTYRWLRDGFWISNATKSSYTLTPQDAGKRISVDVTAARDGFLALKVRATPTGAIQDVFVSPPTPVVYGEPIVGRTLQVITNAWTPAPVNLAYQWKRNGVAIPGATGTAYKLTASDFRARISVTVTGSKSGWVKQARTSSSTLLVRGVLTVSNTPTIGGTTKVGSTLTARPGVWAPSPVSLTYQWKRDGVNISGATGKTYKLAAADRGRRITVTVTGTKSGYQPLVRTSVGVAIG